MIATCCVIRSHSPKCVVIIDASECCCVRVPYISVLFAFRSYSPRTRTAIGSVWVPWGNLNLLIGVRGWEWDRNRGTRCTWTWTTTCRNGPSDTHTCPIQLPIWWSVSFIYVFLRTLVVRWMKPLTHLFRVWLSCIVYSFPFQIIVRQTRSSTIYTTLPYIRWTKLDGRSYHWIEKESWLGGLLLMLRVWWII